MALSASPIQQLVESVAAGPKYRNICEALIRRIGEQELVKRRNLREAIKATKNKLHQAAGAYLESGPRYATWLKELQAAAGDNAALRQACIKIMGAHASTRERLPILDEFYTTVFAGLPPLRSVLDIACGLNPLAIPWMPLAADATYYAGDIYRDMMAFLNDFMGLLPVSGQAQARDVLQWAPMPRVEMALLLKAIPCLEQVDKSAGLQLLDTIQADYLLVSFPVHSLGKREKGMVENYEAHFMELVAGKPYVIKRFLFATELAFLLKIDR